MDCHFQSVSCLSGVWIKVTNILWLHILFAIRCVSLPCSSTKHNIQCVYLEYSDSFGQVEKFFNESGQWKNTTHVEKICLALPFYPALLIATPYWWIFKHYGIINYPLLSNFYLEATRPHALSDHMSAKLPPKTKMKVVWVQAWFFSISPF
jgi:hypothetical protein